MPFYKITITETRERSFYVEEEFDFEAERYIEECYVNGENTLNNDNYIKSWSMKTEVVDEGKRFQRVQRGE